MIGSFKNIKFQLLLIALFNPFSYCHCAFSLMFHCSFHVFNHLPVLIDCNTRSIWISASPEEDRISVSRRSNNSGGQEATILSLYTSMMHWGAIIASPGYTDPVLFGAGGNPYGTSVTVDQNGKMIVDFHTSFPSMADCGANSCTFKTLTSAPASSAPSAAHLAN